jgi:hypothetical protein
MADPDADKRLQESGYVKYKSTLDDNGTLPYPLAIHLGQLVRNPGKKIILNHDVILRPWKATRQVPLGSILTDYDAIKNETELHARMLRYVGLHAEAEGAVLE